MLPVLCSVRTSSSSCMVDSSVLGSGSSMYLWLWMSSLAANIPGSRKESSTAGVISIRGRSSRSVNFKQHAEVCHLSSPWWSLPSCEQKSDIRPCVCNQSFAILQGNSSFPLRNKIRLCSHLYPFDTSSLSPHFDVASCYSYQLNVWRSSRGWRGLSDWPC